MTSWQRTIRPAFLSALALLSCAKQPPSRTEARATASLALAPAPSSNAIADSSPDDSAAFEVRPVNVLPQPAGVPWCWAAVAQTITEAINPGHALRMCRHAEVAFSKNFCCDPTDDDLQYTEINVDCEKNAWPQFNHVGTDYAADRRSGRRWPDWETIKAELKRRPFAVTEEYADQNSSAHMKLVFGYVTANDTEWLLTYDPQDRIYGWFRWQAYRRGDNGLFKPSRLYYNVRLKEQPAATSAGGGPGTGGSASSNFGDDDQSVEDEEAESLDGGHLPETSGVHFNDGSPSLGDAKAASLKLLQKMADSPRFALFGFVAQSEVSGADWCTPEAGAVEVWKHSEARMFNYCADGTPRGALTVGEFRKNWWTPYRIITRLPADAAAEKVARARLGLLGHKGTLVWLPALGVYFLRADVNGTSKYMPVQKVGKLEPNRLYTEPAVADGVKDLVPKPPRLFKHPLPPPP